MSAVGGGGTQGFPPTGRKPPPKQPVVSPNAGRFQEFDGFSTRDANGDEIPIQSKTEPFQCVEGVMKVPTGSGLGLIIDPNYIKKHTVVTAW